MSLEEKLVAVNSTPAPEPGLYPGVDAEIYHSWDAVNQTTLKKFGGGRTPAHVLQELKSGEKPTKQMELGTLTHLATFEPDRYASEVIVAPKPNLQSKKQKKEWIYFQQEMVKSDRIVAIEEDHAKAIAMAKSVRAHTTAGLFLRGSGRNEIAIVWHEEIEEGVFVKCKAKIDRYGRINDYPAIGDLKTAESAIRRDFERSIFKFGYHIQAAHYLTGLETLHPTKVGREPFRIFVCLVVETKPPYLVATFQMDEETIEEGIERRAVSLKKYREAVELGNWPGYPEGLQTVGLPPWALKMYHDD